MLSNTASRGTEQLEATLCIATRVFKCFLKCLCGEITTSILVLQVMDIAPWVQHLSTWGATPVLLS